MLDYYEQKLIVSKNIYNELLKLAYNPQKLLVDEYVKTDSNRVVWNQENQRFEVINQTKSPMEL